MELIYNTSLGYLKVCNKLTIYREWLFTKDVFFTHYVILNQIIRPKIKRYTKMRTRFGLALQKNKGVLGDLNPLLYIFI